MKRHLLKKYTAVLLALVMALSLLPIQVLAGEQTVGNSASYLNSLAFGGTENGYPGYQMDPTFGTNTMNYTVTVPDYTNSLYFRTVASNDNDKILATYTNSWGSISGLPVTSGKWGRISILKANSIGKEFNIRVGSNPGVGSTTDTVYNIKVQRRVTLSDLMVNDTLCPDFDRDTLNYTVGVPENAETLNITSTTFQQGYNLTINGETATSGTVAAITLNWDVNGKMTVPIEVSCDGAVSNTYTLTLIKETIGDTPILSVQPQSATYLDTATNPKTLTVRAVANGTLSYQWYSNTENSTENGIPITDATGSSYVPTILNVGTETKTTYYYCVVTNNKEDNTSYTTKSDPAAVIVKPDPTPTAKIITNDGSEIPAGGYSYDTGAPNVISLKAVAETRAVGGTWTYEWYRGENWSAPGTYDQQMYIPQTVSDGTLDIFCIVTYTIDGISYTATTFSVAVKVTATSAQVPVISAQPLNAAYLIGTNDIYALNVIAGNTDNGSLTYQWYSSNDNKKFTAIEGATSSSYTPPSSSVEANLYYYCEITNTVDSSNGNRYTAAVKSDTTTVSFKTAAELGCNLDGEGTETKPYLIKSQEDLGKLRDTVNTGVTFKNCFFSLTDDITLPDGWVPIGALKPGQLGGGNGVNIRPFSGTIDGKNHTITIPEGGLPLLGYVRNATVKNMNIYGKKIAGYGLVNNYNVDYGPTGSYGSCNVDTINIYNVTLKSGSQTQKSGFIGGYASGINTVNIRNSTIEKDVVIGYDKDQNGIGSFVGEFNGTVENCVSYATVYGTSNVGGLIGVKGQSMGSCSVADSAFHGTVLATGSYAGGIIGGGYNGGGTAPNTPCVSILNSYCDGSITGTDYVGGLLGGEPACKQCWANGIGYIQNNYFTGTVAATTAGTENIGGVIGFMKSLDRYNVISNNYYLDSCGAIKGIGKVEAVDKTATARYNRTDDPTGSDADKLTKSATAAQLMDGTVLAALNSGINSSGNWVKGEKYPVFGSALHLTGFKVTGYKSTYHGGDSLDLSALIVTATYSDYTTKAIDVSRVTFTGFDSTTKGYKTVTAIYDKHIFIFEVQIVNDYVPTPGSTTDKISVSFSLLGDNVHDSDSDGAVHTLKSGNLQSWLAPENYTVSSDARVIDVFAAALSKYGYTWYNQNKLNDITSNYIQSISNPSGVKLGEFTNGKYSGWMYTLNGTHPTNGVAEQKITNGDIIVFHYTDDYRVEEGSEKWNSGTGGTTTGDTTGSTTVSPTVTAQNGLAAVTIGESELINAIKNAGKDKITEIVVAPVITGTARKVTVELQKSSLSSVASDTSADLSVKTPVGNVTIPNKTLSSIAGQTDGSTITISLDAVAATSLNAAQQTAVGKNQVFDISIMSNSKHISHFDGSITVSLPYMLKDGESADGVVVWYLNDTGKLELMKCTYDKTSGLASFTTTHMSYYMVSYDISMADWINPFKDVAKNSWFFDGIKFVYQKNLMTGTGKNTFEPNADMTRAMLVTVLYSLDGKPTVSGTNSFTDVKDGQWYSDAVKWASSKGIVSGYSRSLFGTNDSITREQLATILYNYAKYKDYNVTASTELAAYTDYGNISSWANTSMKWAVSEKLISGTSVTALSPGSDATRAQVATILMNFIKKYVK